MLSIIITHGSNGSGKVTGAIMVLLGIMFAVASFGSQTRIGAAFMHGKGQTVPIGSVGRLILFTVALVLVIAGLRNLIR
jgi:hypothetical protein